LVGGVGGALYNDVCPEDQVVIGYTGLTGIDIVPNFLQSLATVYGKPMVSSTPPYVITIASGPTLPRRGLMGTMPWTTTCPANQVVVGFDSKADNYFKELSIICAPLTVTVSGVPATYQVSVGATTTLPPAGGPGGSDMPTVLCPPGQVVRGNPLRAGQWIDAFSTACATPTLAYPLGARCVTSNDCDQGICTAGRCAALSCVGHAGCTCGVFESVEYAFCATPGNHTDAATACTALGMRLARVDSDAENGWVRSTATQHGLLDLLLGGDSLATPMEWRWPDGTLFWQGDVGGTAPIGSYSHWQSSQPNSSPACAFVNGDAWWVSTSCNTNNTFPYACKDY
jgi:hypothetical protein